MECSLSLVGTVKKPREMVVIPGADSDHHCIQ